MKFHLIESSLLKHPHQVNPCYRKVICYSFFRYLKQNNQTLAQTEFTRMANCVEKKQLFLLSNFLGIYPTLMTENGDQGYIIVESTRGCFPLVIYPDSHSQINNIANKTRKSALSTVLWKLKTNQVKIFETLDEHDEWTLELESKLEKLFEYPHVKSHSNDPNYKDSTPKTA